MNWLICPSAAPTLIAAGYDSVASLAAISDADLERLSVPPVLASELLQAISVAEDPAACRGQC